MLSHQDLGAEIFVLIGVMKKFVSIKQYLDVAQSSYIVNHERKEAAAILFGPKKRLMHCIVESSQECTKVNDSLLLPGRSVIAAAPRPFSDTVTLVPSQSHLNSRELTSLLTLGPCPAAVPQALANPGSIQDLQANTKVPQIQEANENLVEMKQIKRKKRSRKRLRTK